MAINRKLIHALTILFLLTTGLNLFAHADSLANGSQTNETLKTENPVQTWWEKRNQQRDLFYPHNAHMEVMKENGDSCLLCHSFNKSSITNVEQQKQLTTIANEPLEAVCHSCHVEKKSAPWRCELCHSQKESIWPEDHNLDYINHHREDAIQNEQVCASCHLELSFCTSCHFKRQPRASEIHPLGYIGRHGLEVRMDAVECGNCHNPGYCRDCHRGGK